MRRKLCLCRVVRPVAAETLKNRTGPAQECTASAAINLIWAIVVREAEIFRGACPRTRPGPLRAALPAKAPYDKLLERMATAIIAKDDAAFGIAGFARAPCRFGVALDGRRWRG